MAKRDKQKELEKRRLRAGRLLLEGMPQVEVAERVGVAKSTVSGWAKRLEAGGLEALRGTRALGRPGGLEQLACLDSSDHSLLENVSDPTRRRTSAAQHADGLATQRMRRECDRCRRTPSCAYGT